MYEFYDCSSVMSLHAITSLFPATARTAFWKIVSQLILSDYAMSHLRPTHLTVLISSGTYGSNDKAKVRFRDLLD